MARVKTGRTLFNLLGALSDKPYMEPRGRALGELADDLGVNKPALYALLNAHSSLFLRDTRDKRTYSIALSADGKRMAKRVGAKFERSDRPSETPAANGASPDPVAPEPTIDLVSKTNGNGHAPVETSIRPPSAMEVAESLLRLAIAHASAPPADEEVVALYEQEAEAAKGTVVRLQAEIDQLRADNDTLRSRVDELTVIAKRNEAGAEQAIRLESQNQALVRQVQGYERNVRVLRNRLKETPDMWLGMDDSERRVLESLMKPEMV